MATATPSRTPRRRNVTLAQRLANSARALKYYYEHKRVAVAFDPLLTKPVGIAAPTKPDSERGRLEAELVCLRREAAATHRAITQLEKQLAS